MVDYNKLPILVYDSECTMCNRFRQGIQSMDVNNSINCISLHDEKLYLHYPKLNFDDCSKTVHLITESEILKGPEVIEYLLGIIPAVKKLSWLLESEQGKKAIDFFYSKVNELRDKKIGCSSCKK